MKPDIDSEEISELELALSKRARKTFDVEIADVLGHNKKPIGKARMRLVTLGEQEEAIKKAFEYVEKHSSFKDPDAYENSKTAHILHKCLIRENSNLPVFSGPSAMIDNLSPLELASLLNHYNEIKRVCNPVDYSFDGPWLDAFAQLCSEHEDTDAPNMILAKYDSEAIAEIAIRIAIKYHGLKKA